MQNKNLEKIILGLRTLLLSALLFAVTQPAQAAMTDEYCNGNICTSYTAGDPLQQDSTGIDPNLLININFSVYTKPSFGAPACTGSRQLYHAIRHYVNGDPNNYEYTRVGLGSSVDFQFNSLSAGNRNVYNGVFFCWTQAVTDKGGLDTLLGTLNTQGQAWQTRQFNLTTRTKTSETDPSLGGGGKEPSLGGNGGTDNSNTNNSSTIDCKINPDKCLYNPLATDDLTTIFLWIARGFLGIIAIWSVIFIIVGGFRMVMSQGNEEAYTTAKKTVTWAVLGLLIALLSFSIVAIVTNLIGANVQETRLIKP